jgi:hypothetical protein
MDLGWMQKKKVKHSICQNHIFDYRVCFEWWLAQLCLLTSSLVHYWGIWSLASTWWWGMISLLTYTSILSNLLKKSQRMDFLCNRKSFIQRTYKNKHILFRKRNPFLSKHFTNAIWCYHTVVHCHFYEDMMEIVQLLFSYLWSA